MIPRYSRPEMSALWSEPHKLAVWKEVETLVVEAWVELGIAPQEAAAALRATGEVDLDAWREREAVTHHDVAAFVDVLGDDVAHGREWVHYGLTSSDVLDTAQGVILREAANLLLAEIARLFAVVKARAVDHRNTVMVGRTHGIWAEPTSFGLKLATWAFELARDHDRMLRARDVVAVGKISGAVGTYAHTPPQVEAFVLEQLGLEVEPASSQITHRDRHAEYLNTIALVGASLERFATEIRHLQRSEVREVREAFRSGQKGSSAMPHKRNPIAAENLTGVARLLRGYAASGMENVALWHERDISHSSVERVALPDASILLDYALDRMTRLVEGLVVDDAQMARNLEATQGLVYSQAVLLALIDEQDLSRDEAYTIVQRNGMRAWDEGRQLQDLIAADEDVVLTADTLAACFSPERHLENAAVVFERLDATSV
jgi:adenylosuccinate lyase